MQKISGKEFTLNILNGISLGVVVTLVPSALVGQLMKALTGIFPMATTIIAMTTFTMSLLAAVSGFCVGYLFKFNMIQTSAVAAAAMIGSGVITQTKAGYTLSGTGDVINTAITITLAVIVARFIGDKFKNYTVLLLPTLVIIIAGGLGLVALPFIKMVTTFIGIGVKNLVTLQPILMGALVGVVFAILILSPISSVGIATAISLAGIAAGSANLGIVAGSFTLAIMGSSVNTLGTTLAHFIGTPKIQMANMLEKPFLFIPVIINAAILGALGAIFNIQGTAMSAGFGFSGLIGPLAAWNEMSANIGSILILVILFLLLPIVLGFTAKYIFVQKTKQITPMDLLIQV
ncbi:PTS sugar transporter subunit IIC [Ligilactobacillus sp. WILCCON 0076]|uniref:PTS sugar transporter subunit IIC n=1 Tax=Ligilactobacillus ubinensis TaxID=2876789 RepID=A0A9X2JLR2_9LACO|nr:PTS sugar transporter subunit IIC [Ligilactobacillus ubinensis]MCP0887277.1 PTS sugar transporter subunit IIC [Ligilactobacillus ubinensis]